MRTLTDVINQLLAIVPADQLQLRAGLESIRSSVMFTAPEAIGDRWHEAAYLLAHHLGDKIPPEGTWQRRVHGVFTGKAVTA